jgi:hypothetical protein
MMQLPSRFYVTDVSIFLRLQCQYTTTQPLVGMKNETSRIGNLAANLASTNDTFLQRVTQKARRQPFVD